MSVKWTAGNVRLAAILGVTLSIGMGLPHSYWSALVGGLLGYLAGPVLPWINAGDRTR